jgi:ABC-type Fe3+/spermidine/putrescine transport system ATPase subunit
VLVVIRPQGIMVSPSRRDTADENVFPAQIERLQFLGDAIEAEVSIGKAVLRVMLDAYLQANVGDTVWLELPPDRCVVVEHVQDAVARAGTESA